MRRSAILALALGACATAPAGDPPGYARDCRFVVYYQPESAPERAAVVGDFNGWDERADPLVSVGADNLFAAVITAKAGAHQYRIWADGETVLDRLNPLTLVDAEGQENSAVEVPDCSRPALETEQLAASPEGRLEVDLRFLRAADGRALGAVAATLDDGQPVETVVTDPRGDLHLAATGLRPGKHRLTVTAADRAGVEAETLLLPFWVEDEPFDWRDAVIYQVMVDRFRKGDGLLADDAPISFYHGGDLWGLIAAVTDGYFARLGVNTLWISPMYENPAGRFTGRDGHEAEPYHGYWPSEPRTVEQRFGGETALEALVTSAHKRGLRVIMDAVPNHVHINHPYFREHVADGWFNHPAGGCICGLSCPWAGHMEDCWFDPFLPDLRWEDQDAAEQMLADLVWWLERFDLDGLRIDAVPMMPRLAVRHLRDRVHRALEASGTPVFLLGETYTDRGGQAVIRYYLGPQSLSGQFDFPVMWALRDALAGRSPMTDLDHEVRASEAAWVGSGAVMAPILGNHDVARFISDVNGDPIWEPWDRPPSAPTRAKPYDLLAIAWTFLLSQPGAPVIYYGDEIGLPGATDPDNRRNMRFDAALSAREAAMLAHVGRLGRARACSTALRRGVRRTLVVNDNLYVYGRDAGAGRLALVVLNRATVARPLEVRIPDDWSFPDPPAFADVLGAVVTVAGRTVSLTVPPRASALILSETDCVGGGS